jgi:hypothetical protein
MLLREALGVEHKVCSTCKGDPQPIENFNWRNREKGVRQATCRTCKILHQQRWYQRHKKVHQQNVKRYKQHNAEIIRDNLVAYLQDHPCVDCGEKDIVVLHFDHIDADSKEVEISRLVWMDRAWPRVLKEVEKCAIRCANCHMRRTAKQLGWFKARFL